VSLLLKRSFSLAPLAVAFLGSACGVSEDKYEALQTKYNADTQQLRAQNADLNQRVASLEGQVSRLQDAIRYTVNSDLLFAPGSWQISTAGQQIMARIASQLAATQTQKIVVNGHTDNAAVGRRLQQEGITSNQVLSEKRAESVMEYLVSHGVKPGLVSAKGWGDTQPIAPNDTVEDRAQNRRVEIALAPGS
jgi:chemotaxis protein MotB